MLEEPAEIEATNPVAPTTPGNAHPAPVGVEAAFAAMLAYLLSNRVPALAVDLGMRTNAGAPLGAFLDHETPYGVGMGVGAVLAADSFPKEGEEVPPHARWGGNPATEARVSHVRQAGVHVGDLGTAPPGWG